MILQQRVTAPIARPWERRAPWSEPAQRAPRQRGTRGGSRGRHVAPARCRRGRRLRHGRIDADVNGADRDLHGLVGNWRDAAGCRRLGNDARGRRGIRRRACAGGRRFSIAARRRCETSVRGAVPIPTTSASSIVGDAGCSRADDAAPGRTCPAILASADADTATMSCSCGDVPPVRDIVRIARDPLQCGTNDGVMRLGSDRRRDGGGRPRRGGGGSRRRPLRRREVRRGLRRQRNMFRPALRRRTLVTTARPMIGGAACAGRGGSAAGIAATASRTTSDSTISPPASGAFAGATGPRAPRADPDKFISAPK